MASANSASTKYTEGGHRYWPYYASTRLCGIEVGCIPRGRGRGRGFSFLSKRPAGSTLALSASALAFASGRQQTRFPPASPRPITAFSCFLLVVPLRHAHSWKCDARIPLAGTPSMVDAVCGNQPSGKCHAWPTSIALVVRVAGLVPAASPQPNSSCCMI